jgi:hypothetical protein
MKMITTTMKTITVATLLALIAFGPSALQAHETHGDFKRSSAAKAYPLKTCLVTGDKLGSHGPAYVIIHEGQEVQFCCKVCLDPFKKDPAKLLRKIKDAEKK